MQPVWVVGNHPLQCKPYYGVEGVYGLQKEKSRLRYELSWAVKSWSLFFFFPSRADLWRWVVTSYKQHSFSHHLECNRDMVAAWLQLGCSFFFFLFHVRRATLSMWLGRWVMESSGLSRSNCFLLSYLEISLLGWCVELWLQKGPLCRIPFSDSCGKVSPGFLQPETRL